jgi:hypothetical protein
MASEDNRSRRSDVEGLGAAGPQGDRHPVGALGDDRVRQPLALGAEANRRGSRERVELFPPVRDQSDTRLSRRVKTSLDGRRGEDRPHAGADGLGREGIGAIRTEDDGAAKQGVGSPDDRPDVPGVPDALQVEGRRLRPLCPLQGPHRDHPRPRAKGRDVGQQRRLHLFASEVGSRRDQHEPRLRPRRETRLEQILALGREGVLALAVLAVPQLADQLQLLVLGAFDHRMVLWMVLVLFCGFFSWNEKAGR